MGSKWSIAASGTHVRGKLGEEWYSDSTRSWSSLSRFENERRGGDGDDGRGGDDDVLAVDAADPLLLPADNGVEADDRAEARSATPPKVTMIANADTTLSIFVKGKAKL